MSMNKSIRKLMTTVLAASLLLVAACGANVNAASTTPNTNAGISDSVALAYDPADSSLLKADHDGLQRWHTDSGWETVKTPQASNLSSIVVNPDDPTTLYISGVGMGVSRSNDGGNTWQSINTGLPSLDITALALHSFQRETLYIWVRDKGIYRTEDGGATWRQVPDRGPQDTHVQGLIFSTLPGSMNTGWLYIDTPTGAYMSMDCFCGWRAAGSLPANAAIRSIAVDPQTPQRVYAAGPGGLFRSDDGGLDWTQSDTGLTGKPIAVTLIPAKPKTVLVVLSDSSVWQSTDGATSWQQLKASQ